MLKTLLHKQMTEIFRSYVYDAKKNRKRSKAATIGLIVLCIGAVTGLWGVILAALQNDVKKLLAYSSIENIGIIFIALGTALLGKAEGSDPIFYAGMAGALLHTLNHSFFKSLLFMGAGNIYTATHTTSLDDLGGLGKRMPVTMMCFTLAALSLIGIPPLAGFVSKWYLLDAGLEAPLQVFGIAGLVVLVLSALLTAGYLLPIVTAGFFPGRDFSGERKEVGKTMLAPMLCFSAASVLLGLFPGPLMSWLGGLIPKMF